MYYSIFGLFCQHPSIKNRQLICIVKNIFNLSLYDSIAGLDLLFTLDSLTPYRRFISILLFCSAYLLLLSILLCQNIHKKYFFLGKRLLYTFFTFYYFVQKQSY